MMCFCFPSPTGFSTAMHSSVPLVLPLLIQPNTGDIPTINLFPLTSSQAVILARAMVFQVGS